MASLAHDHSRRHDTRRRRRRAADSDAVSDVDEVEDPQLRGSNQRKKPQKHQTPTHVTFEIHGPVTISNDFNLGHEDLDDRRRPTSSATRGSTGRLQRSKKRPTTPCDFQSDDPSSSEEDESSYSEDSAPYNGQSRRVAKAKMPHERNRVNAGRRTKRYQADEGYHTGSTASHTAEPSTQSTKARVKDMPSKASGSSARHARLSSSVKSRKAMVVESDSEPTEGHSEEGSEEGTDDQNSAEEPDDEDDEDDEEDASDDDFGKLAVQISSRDFSKSIDEKAVLDTGTKPDWISARFYDELKSSGIPVEKVKLSAEEQKSKYSDFNNKKFSPTSKVELIVQSDEFTGAIKCRNLSFLVAGKATFSILIGRDTIRKQKLMTRGKPDPDGEGVFVGVHGDIPEEERAAIKKKREEQNKAKEERKKQRDAKLEETLKTKTKAKISSNQVAAHLATLVSRSSRTRSPHCGKNKGTKHSERQSDSSLEGTW